MTGMAKVGRPLGGHNRPDSPSAVEGAARRAQAIKLLQSGKTQAEVAQEMGLGNGTIYNWRVKFPDFRDAVKQYQIDGRRPGKNRIVVDADRDTPPKGSFADWRVHYTGRLVEPHQVSLVRALEDRTNNKIIWLGPPGSGKDTTAQDWLLYELCDDRSGLRAAWMMESDDFSIRRLERLGRYLTDPLVYRATPEGATSVQPTGSLIADYGPFRWQPEMYWAHDGTPVTKVPWSQHRFYFVQNIAPEADPTLWATGVGGAIYGSRIGLLVVSDPFTRENQRSGTQRATQMDFIKGTVRTRLDGRGRIVVLGTRVGSDEADNYPALIRYFVGRSRVIYEDTYYRKYANGTAVVIQPAVVFNAAGEEESYWPSKFPLRDQIILPDGSWLPTAEMADPELLSYGHRDDIDLIEGLLSIQADDQDTFATVYQQNPPHSVGGEFVDVILDHCDDLTRTYGVHRPKEQLVFGVDPARSGGAAWVMWAIDKTAQTLTVVDWYYGEKLGIPGITRHLILDPIEMYLPREMCYETNHEASVLLLPEVQQIIRDAAVRVKEHHTGVNRSMGEGSVASMSLGMRAGTIRFPMATPADRQRTAFLKQQFRNWDSHTQTGRTRSGQFSHQPDDLCMAAWIGWLRAKELLEVSTSERIMRRVVPAVVAKRWKVNGPGQTPDAQAPPVTDVVGLFFRQDAQGD